MSTVGAVLQNEKAGDTGKWNKGSGTGWDHLILFSDLWDLVGQLERLNQKGQVQRLGIVAHGDQGGIVQLDRDLTAESALSFKSEFSALSQFRIPFGRLIFFSCIAGSGVAGTKLLNLLSGSFLRDRHVIGFEVVGYIAQSGFDNSPGGVLADLSPLKQRPNLVQADQTGD